MDVLQLVKNLGLKYVDARDSGGALWVIGGLDLSPAMCKLRDSGFSFAYQPGGWKSSGYKDAWWYKPPYKPTDDTIMPDLHRDNSNSFQLRRETGIQSTFFKNLQANQPQSQVFGNNTGGTREGFAEKDSSSHLAGNAVLDTIVSIVNEHFPNGIRPDSVIDSNKLKKYYADATGEDIAKAVSDIPATLGAIGIRHGDKVYAVSAKARQELTKLLERLLSEENRLFYYDEIYDAHSGFFRDMNIFSSELLKTVLSEITQSLWFQNKNYRLHFYKNYCLTDRNITVESEILRCYETAVCLSYDQLKTRLPYIPIVKIKQILAQNSDFIWVNTGVYTHAGKIEFDDVECRAAYVKIEEAVSRGGFATLASINIRASAKQNPDLSESALKNGFFQTYLANRYENRGNIISPKGNALKSAALFEIYCRESNRLTLNDLVSVEVAVNGDNHSKALSVAYDNMVRIDRNTFIRDGEIQFDVDAVDASIELFVQGNVIPLQAVSSFTSFPYIEGYKWNLFLLESYCRRFSKLFKYQCLSVNSENIGAIIKKAADFADYTEALAYAVASAPVILNNKDAGNYLFESGYIARRGGIVADVVARAQILRERRV